MNVAFIYLVTGFFIAVAVWLKMYGTKEARETGALGLWIAFIVTIFMWPALLIYMVLP